MNQFKIKVGLIGLGISVFVYNFGYVLQNAYNIKFFVNPPDVVDIGLAGLGLALIIGTVIPILYMATTYLIDEYKLDKQTKCVS